MDANDISNLFGQTPDVPQISGTWDNSNYGTDASDPDTGFECYFNMDGLQNTIWYSFTGDGNNYLIRSIECNNSTSNLDLQMSIYSGACDNFVAEVCNEDENEAGNLLNFSTEFLTEAGETYWIMVDGYQGQRRQYWRFLLDWINKMLGEKAQLYSPDLRV